MSRKTTKPNGDGKIVAAGDAVNQRRYDDMERAANWHALLTVAALIAFWSIVFAVLS